MDGAPTGEQHRWRIRQLRVAPARPDIGQDLVDGVHRKGIAHTVEGRIQRERQQDGGDVGTDPQHEGHWHVGCRQPDGEDVEDEEVDVAEEPQRAPAERELVRVDGPARPKGPDSAYHTQQADEGVSERVEVAHRCDTVGVYA